MPPELSHIGATIAVMNLREQRLYVAKRTGLLARLAQQERLGDARAEALLAAWDAEAERIGVGRDHDDFWPLARRWIAEQLPERDISPG